MISVKLQKGASCANDAITEAVSNTFSPRRTVSILIAAFMKVSDVSMTPFGKFQVS